MAISEFLIVARPCRVIFTSFIKLLFRLLILEPVEGFSSVLYGAALPGSVLDWRPLAINAVALLFQRMIGGQAQPAK